jgi:hypothetical protein
MSNDHLDLDPLQFLKNWFPDFSWGGAATLFVWLISHQPAVLFFQNKPVTSQQYFSFRTNQPPATSQQYFSLGTNQHQPSATSQTNRLNEFLRN